MLQMKLRFTNLDANQLARCLLMKIFILDLQACVLASTSKWQKTAEEHQQMREERLKKGGLQLTYSNNHR